MAQDIADLEHSAARRIRQDAPRAAQKYGGSHLLRHGLATDRYLCLVHPELRHRRLEGRQDVTRRTQPLTNSGALHSVLVPPTLPMLNPAFGSVAHLISSNDAV
jgi:hypothetical protein